MIALGILGAVFAIYILGPYAVCAVRGHNWDDSVSLWRTCKCCGKHQTLHVMSGTYVD